MNGFPIYRTGATIPKLGFGTWQIPKNKVSELVKEALDVGYKHIDCALVYENEYELGHELFSDLKNRHELFITSKLWSNYHEPHRVKIGFEKTLSDLCLDYLDLYLIHNPVRCNPTSESIIESKYFKKEWILETWREMEKLYDTGECKAIGVSNFTTTKLQWLIDEASVIPHVNQVELHPYLPQNKLVEFCRNNRIQVVAYSPLGTPATRHTISGKPDAPILLEDPAVIEIAKKNGITPAQTLIAWGLQRDMPLLVKSSSRNRMIENKAAENFKLPESDIKTLSNMKTQYRFIQFDMFLTEGKTVEDYWNGELYN